MCGMIQDPIKRRLCAWKVGLEGRLAMLLLVADIFDDRVDAHSTEGARSGEESPAWTDERAF